MAAFRDDKPIVVGINENWDEDTTCAQIVRPDWDFSVARIISQDIYSYEPCGLPTGDFMPAERAQIRLMTASPVTLRV